jgi:hypothetical protein
MIAIIIVVVAELLAIACHGMVAASRADDYAEARPATIRKRIVDLWLKIS